MWKKIVTFLVHFFFLSLASWQHALTRGELCEKINFSLYYKTNEFLDTDLLLACKEEFHRRLQIYQQWKELNESSTIERQINRIPMAILASSKSDNMTIIMLTTFLSRHQNVILLPWLSFFFLYQRAAIVIALSDVKNEVEKYRLIRPTCNRTIKFYYMSHSLE